MAKKRGQGEGTLIKRPNGTWMAQVSIQGRRQTKYFKTQKDGLEWLHRMRSQIQAGLTMGGAQQSLDSYLEQWLGSMRQSVRTQTLQQYRQIVKNHISPRLGRIKLQELMPH